MKAITIKQPWASLICSGIKDIENRTWKTNYRGHVLIHAGITNVYKPYLFNQKQMQAIYDAGKDDEMYYSILPAGAIIGSVDIVDCVINHPSIWAEKSEIQWVTTENGRTIGAERKPIYNWILANPIIFPKPIPAKGKLSLWDYPNNLDEPEQKEMQA